MSLDRSDTTDPYAHGTAERPTVEEGSKLNISPVQSRHIEPQDAHWLRMDPSLTRAVLAKTEEELLGGLAALMRNKVEHEQVSRRLAQVQIETAQAKDELDAIKQQIRGAEEEVAVRINEQSRVGEEITKIRTELAILREEHSHHLEVVSSLKNDAAQVQQLLVEAHQRLGRVKDEADAKFAEHMEVTAQLDQVKNEKVALENEQALLRAEVHDRIGAREALIQELAILHRHLSDLRARQEHQETEVSQLGNRHAELRKEIERERERANSELAQLLADTEKRRTEHLGLGNQVAEVQKNVGDLLAQKGALEQAVGEMVAKREQLHEEVAALETSLRVLNAAVERAEQARTEEGLPLLFGSEFHPISHEWDSYALESEFHTDEELDAETVAELVAQLPGLEGSLIVKNHGPVLATQLPERLHAHLKVPNRNYNLLFERLEKKVQEYNLPNARLATFDLGDEGLTVAQANHAFVFVNHKQTKLRPGIPDKLASIVTEVAKMYP